MIFSSLNFLFIFLPVTLLFYYVAPRKEKNGVLLVASLVFYAWGEPVYILLMIFSIVFNYLSGLEIGIYKKQKKKKQMKTCFWTTVLVNLAVLGFFKYYGFLIRSLQVILPFKIPYKELPLPIGISFYTFQTLSYIVDVYRGNVPVQKNLTSFGTYIAMFPQLIAGPIVRYPDIEKQLKERTLSWQKFGQGAAWFIRGLGKKVLLANNIGPVFDAISALPASDRSVLTSWVGAIAYAMQIYFDFSGYSDMAIGLGKMFGFEFVRNFKYPYTANSITDFWRRWHISLSTWFREYVYIPLGGNRVSVPRHILNLMIVWMLTGLWHGASWNFVFWGMYYGVLLILEKYLFHNVLELLPRLIQKLITFFLVLIGWVFFFSPTLTEAFSYLGTMFGVHANGLVDQTALYYLQGSFLLLLICIAGCTRYPCLLARRWLSNPGKISFARVWIFYLGVLIFSVAYLVNATYNPFLYFRF